MSDSINLSDEQIAKYLDSVSDEMRGGEKSRSELCEDLAAILVLEDDVLIRDGPLKSQGRLTFGAPYEGMPGTGFYIPPKDADV